MPRAYAYFTAIGECPRKPDLPYSIVMPVWQQVGNASQTAQAHWQDYLTNLMAHEQGHVKRFGDFWSDKQTLKKLAKLMKTLAYGEAHDPGRARQLAKEALKAEIDRVIDDLNAACNKVQIKYDKDTDHGEQQSNIGGLDAKSDGSIATW